MFVAVYRFDVIAEKEKAFKEAWRALTELILKHENSLGSRLHHEKDLTYIAYAQWHSKEQWKNAGENLPEEAAEWRAQMKASCIEIKTIHELEMVDDLLVKYISS